MHELVEARRAEVAALYREFGILRMDVFGSAVGSSFDVDHSDIDVLIEFVERPNFDRFESYFGLKEALEQLFGRAVDIVSSSSLRNPYFRDRVLETKELLYAA